MFRLRNEVDKRQSPEQKIVGDFGRLRPTGADPVKPNLNSKMAVVSAST